MMMRRTRSTPKVEEAILKEEVSDGPTRAATRSQAASYSDQAHPRQLSSSSSLTASSRMRTSSSRVLWAFSTSLGETPSKEGSLFSRSLFAD